MGTHPIFESDFDCLTEWKVWSRWCGRLKCRCAFPFPVRTWPIARFLFLFTSLFLPFPFCPSFRPKFKNISCQRTPIPKSGLVFKAPLSGKLYAILYLARVVGIRQLQYKFEYHITYITHYCDWTNQNMQAKYFETRSVPFLGSYFIFRLKYERVFHIIFVGSYFM